MSGEYDLPESPDIDDKLRRLEDMIEALACALHNSTVLKNDDFAEVADVVWAIQSTTYWKERSKTIAPPDFR